MLAPGAVEWHAVHAGVALRNTASPSAMGLSAPVVGRAPGGAAPLAAWPGDAPAAASVPGKVAPDTRMGRGGQPWLSTLLTQSRKAISAVMSSSLRFCLGISLRCLFSS